MSFFFHLLRRLGLVRPERISFDLELGDRLALRDLARRERRSSNEVAADLLAEGLARRQAAGANLERWRALSPREQEVVALICLGHTTRQMAARLQISPETVNSHVYNALGKFGMRRRTELRQALGDWDFSAWIGGRRS